MNVRFHIDRLVLEGFSPAEGRRVGAALERELGRLVSRNGLPTGVAEARHIPRLDAGSLAIRPNARPRAVGRQLARQVYGGLKR